MEVWDVDKVNISEFDGRWNGFVIEIFYLFFFLCNSFKFFIMLFYFMGS